MHAWFRSSTNLIVGAATIAVIFALIVRPFDVAVPFIAFVALTAVCEMLDVTLPNDARYSLGLAPALGFALYGAPPVAATLLVYAVGAGIALSLRSLLRQEIRIIDTATHLLSLGTAAVIYNGIAGVSWLPDFARTDLSMLGLAAMLGTVLGVESTLRVVRAVGTDPIPALPVFLGLVRSTATMHLSLLSASALLALAYPTLRYWAFPLILAPLVATQYAFRQFASIRRTYLQTIRALSKVPEMAGYTQKGHSTRVAALSVAVARELGLPQPQVSEIEYAALLHDIGRLSVPDPEDTDQIPPDELARVGGAIVRETGHFPRVAEMIEQQHAPYRSRARDPQDVPAIGAKIIKVTSAYDDLFRPATLGLSPWDAIDRLHTGMTYDFDPIVVNALTRVLEKQGDLP